MSAARMCIACGERPVTTTAHDCCAACAAPDLYAALVIARDWMRDNCPPDEPAFDAVSRALFKVQS